MISWIEDECGKYEKRVIWLSICHLTSSLISKPDDPDGIPDMLYTKSGKYHNGGIWPFICGVYVALCSCKKHAMAQESFWRLPDLLRFQIF